MSFQSVSFKAADLTVLCDTLYSEMQSNLNWTASAVRRGDFDSAKQSADRAEHLRDLFGKCNGALKELTGKYHKQS